MTKSLLVLTLLFFVATSAYAQKITIGMTKAEVEKAYPKFAKELRAHTTAVRLLDFPLHGMTGHADFLFDNGKLLVFTWDHPKDHPEGLTKQDLAKYNALFRGLQNDWGKGYVKPSPYNKAVKETTWKLEKARGSIRYMKDKVHVQMIDADYLEKTKAKAK